MWFKKMKHIETQNTKKKNYGFYVPMWFKKMKKMKKMKI